MQKVNLIPLLMEEVEQKVNSFRQYSDEVRVIFIFSVKRLCLCVLASFLHPLYQISESGCFSFPLTAFNWLKRRIFAYISFNFKTL